MVLAILAILTLMAILLTYTARMETSSARNAGIAVQNRISAQTGIDFVATDIVISAIGSPIIDRDGPPSSEDRTRNSAALSGSSSALEGSDPQASPWDNLSDSRNSPIYMPGRALTPQSQLLVADASARINLNTADESVLEAFFDQLATRTGGGFTGSQVANAILKVRLGNDGAPGNQRTDDSGAGRDAVELLVSGRRGAEGFINTPGDAAQRLAAETLRERTREGDRVRDMQERARRQTMREEMVSGVDSPEDYVGDIRRPAFGDDRRFTSVADLLAYPTIRSTGLGAEALQIALPHLTTFSASLDRQPQRKADEEPRALLDLNRAAPEDIYEALDHLYGGSKSEVLLKQFAVNIVDARDFDSVPTAYPGTEGTAPIIGLERTPFITEVYPMTPAPEEQGHDGQFVEVYNPWSTELDVTGWQLRGAGLNVALTGVIPPDSYLIVTNDSDNRTDPRADRELSSTGSLYDLFGVTGNTTNRRILERRDLQLDMRSHRADLRLHNAAGDLIDQFVYFPRAEPTGGTTSYQRENAVIRVAKRGRPTPFSQATGTYSGGESLKRLASYPPDGPLVCVTDLLDVFAGFADLDAGELEMWAFPVAATPRSTKEADRRLTELSTRIDARVMDLFSLEFRDRPAGVTVGEDRLPEEVTFARDKGAGRSGREVSSGDADRVARAHAEAWIFPVGHRLGRINLNTADATVLASLPGMSPEMAIGVIRERLTEQGETVMVEGWRPMDSPLPRERWAAPSDVLVDLKLWGDSLSEAERIDRLRALLPHVTFSTRAFVIRSQARLPQGIDPNSPEATAGVPMEAVVATDRGTAEVISIRRVQEAMGEVDTVRKMTDTTNRVSEQSAQAATRR
jgi:hypothetical protein